MFSHHLFVFVINSRYFVQPKLIPFYHIFVKLACESTRSEYLLSMSFDFVQLVEATMLLGAVASIIALVILLRTKANK